MMTTHAFFHAQGSPSNCKGRVSLSIIYPSPIQDHLFELRLYPFYPLTYRFGIKMEMENNIERVGVDPPP